MTFLIFTAIALSLVGATAFFLRKNARLRLRESQLILGHISAYFIEIDSDLRVLNTNYYTLNHLPEDPSPKRVGDLLKCRNAVESEGCGLHPRCKTCSIRGSINRALSTGKNFSRLQASMKLIGRDNRQIVPVDVSVSGSLLPGTTPGHARMVLTIVDISDLKNVQRQLETERRRAVAADRMKTAFIANMSHEIRTPLNAIVGFSDLIAGAEDPQEKDTYTRLIDQNSRHLLRLFENILDLAQLESGSAEFHDTDFHTDELLSDLYATFASSPDRNPSVALRTEHSGSAVTLHSERERIGQVLSNFLHNAVKFTQTGEIVLGCRPQADGLVRFYVSDTGPGIPAEHQEKIFGRFTKLDDYIPGTGLGLSLSQLIVRRLGGTIGVESHPGQGSTFWFTIPLKTQ